MRDDSHIINNMICNNKKVTKKLISYNIYREQMCIVMSVTSSVEREILLIITYQLLKQHILTP